MTEPAAAAVPPLTAGAPRKGSVGASAGVGLKGVVRTPSQHLAATAGKAEPESDQKQAIKALAEETTGSKKKIAAAPILGDELLTVVQDDDDSALTVQELQSKIEGIAGNLAHKYAEQGRKFAKLMAIDCR